MAQFNAELEYAILLCYNCIRTGMGLIDEIGLMLFKTIFKFYV